MNLFSHFFLIVGSGLRTSQTAEIRGLGNQLSVTLKGTDNPFPFKKAKLKKTVRKKQRQPSENAGTTGKTRKLERPWKRRHHREWIAATIY